METRQGERIDGCAARSTEGEDPWRVRVSKLEDDNAELLERVERIEAALSIAAAALQVAAERPTA